MDILINILAGNPLESRVSYSNGALLIMYECVRSKGHESFQVAFKPTEPSCNMTLIPTQVIRVVDVSSIPKWGGEIISQINVK